jgi:hypothetical protein
MHVADFVFVAWITAGTLAVRWLFRLQLGGKMGRLLDLVVTVVFAVTPAAVLRCHLVGYSAVTVLVAGAAFVWFLILLGYDKRSNNRWRGP